MSDVEVSYNEIKDMPEALKAYAITGLDSGSRRDDALTELDKVCQELKKWDFLGNTPAEMQAKVEEAYKALRNPIDSLDRWTKKLPDIAEQMSEVPQNPGFALSSSEPEGAELLHRVNEFNSELTLARAEINDAKDEIGRCWASLTEVTKALSEAIETEVKNAVARVHSEGIESVTAITTVGGRILDLLGIIDPTLLGELGLKLVKVGVEGLAEAAKLAMERYNASQMTMEQALAVYGEWDIAMASAERWKGSVKVAIHAAGIVIPKYSLVSGIVDGMVDLYFDIPINKGKKLKEEAKKKAEKGEELEGEENPDSFWDSLKNSVIDKFVPANMGEVYNGLLGGLSGIMDGGAAADIAAEIVGKLSTAIIEVLTENFLPVTPAQEVPALDIKTRLGDLRGVYTNALTREMDPTLKGEFEQAMANVG